VTIQYRLAHAADLLRASELVVASMNHLCQRHGFTPIATARPSTFSHFSSQDDPDGLWVAEDAGDILGFAFSWVCGDLWFLAQLFVSPDQQGHGIGHNLLQRTLEHAQQKKAAIKALITFAFNTVSQGLYIRQGLFPRCPLYSFSIARDALASSLKGERLRYQPLENTALHSHTLAKIDVEVLGTSRAKHHRFLSTERSTRGVLFHVGQEPVGYAYVSEGHVGPLAVTRHAARGAAFRTALHLAAETTASQVSALLPGPCDWALSIAGQAGMRITTPLLLMATEDFGNWTQYLPRNPGFM
jgi:GNAT superfamily N-acetyltransferase